MSKTDKSIHDICIASIKRHTTKPYDFKWTRFYELNSDFKNSFPSISINLSENELFICSTIIDNENYSILTTRRLVTNEHCQIREGKIEGALKKFYGDFKGYKGDQITFGQIQLESGEKLNYHIESGKASMIMIYGIQTILGIIQPSPSGAARS